MTPTMILATTMLSLVIRKSVQVTKVRPKWPDDIHSHHRGQGCERTVCRGKGRVQNDEREQDHESYGQSDMGDNERTDCRRVGDLVRDRYAERNADKS